MKAVHNILVSSAETVSDLNMGVNTVLSICTAMPKHCPIVMMTSESRHPPVVCADHGPESPGVDPVDMA